MAKARSLYIKRLTDGEEHYFPSDVERAKVKYTYTAKRMGGAPTLEATLYYDRCLDDEWTHTEYVEFEGEKYYIDQVPTSSKDSETHMYKHSLTFNSRRVILDNTLFFDAVSMSEQDTDYGDVYRSNMTSFAFYGTLQEFVDRLNDSLTYCDLYNKETDEGYKVVIDDGVDADIIKELSFTDKYITEVIQEIYSTFELTYYWVGTICHVGDAQNNIPTLLSYGRNEALLSVTKENRNNAIVDVITGHGSSDNLPYYYPNSDAYGLPIYYTENFDKLLVNTISLETVFKWDGNIYNDPLTFCKNSEAEYSTALLEPLYGRDAASKFYLNYKAIGFNDDTSVVGERPYNAKDYTTCPKLVPTVNKYTVHGYIGFRYGKYKSVSSSTTTAENEGNFRESVSGMTFYFMAKLTDVAMKGYVDFSKIGIKAKVLSMYRCNGTADPDKVSLNEWPIEFGTTFHYYYCDTGEVDFTNWRRKTAQRGSTDSAVNASLITIDGAPKMTFAGNDVFVLIVGTVYAKNTDTDCFAEIEATLVDEDGIYTFVPLTTQYFLEYGEGKFQPLESSGITVNSIAQIPCKETKYAFSDGAWNVAEVTGTETAGILHITGREWIMPTGYLMPSIYRKTRGRKRFLYALDNTNLLPDSTTDYYSYVNQYVEGNPHMAAVTFDDIKPTINGVKNASGQLFGEIADIAFDDNDSDTTTTTSTSSSSSATMDYDHPYFYLKLHKFDGDYGFDLFAQALASDTAKINLIDSVGCPACSFVIQCIWDSTNNKCYNPVKTDANGSIVSGDSAEKTTGEISNITESNQNSNENEIWIALRKDDSTLGVVMPNVAGNFKPKVGEHFVITGIQMPSSLVLAAEERLDAALLEHMKENNEEKFDFTVKFSRIFLAENTDFASRLNENAKIAVEYNGKEHDLYVSSYTVKADDEALEDVEVELTDELEDSASALRNTIDTVIGDRTPSVGNDTSNSGSGNGGTTDINKYLKDYLSRVNDDSASGVITFLKGLLLGSTTYGLTQYGNATLKSIIAEYLSSEDFDEALQTGYALIKDSSGDYEMFLKNLTVWGKATFNELEIRKVSYAGGNIVLSAAGSRLIQVDEVAGDDGKVTGWRCWALADDGTTATTNAWKVGDQARCQTMNVSGENRNYWRLVTAVSTENETLKDNGGNVLYDGQEFSWFVLSATDCSSSATDTPMAGDTVVQMGHRYADDTDRQGLIILSSSDRSITVYNGIDGYYLETDSYGRNHITFQTSPDKFRVASGTVEIVNYNGDTYYQTFYRGQWQSGTTYFAHEEVDWNGTRWLCTTGNTEGTTEEPSEDSTQWRAETAVLHYQLMIDVDGDRTAIDYGETVTVTCRLYFGDSEVGTDSWSWSLTRDSGDAAADAEWALRKKVKTFSGTIDLTLTHDSATSDIAEDATYGTTFTFTLKKVGTTQETSATLYV